MAKKGKMADIVVREGKIEKIPLVGSGYGECYYSRAHLTDGIWAGSVACPKPASIGYEGGTISFQAEDTAIKVAIHKASQAFAEAEVPDPGTFTLQWDNGPQRAIIWGLVQFCFERGCTEIGKPAPHYICKCGSPYLAAISQVSIWDSKNIHLKPGLYPHFQNKKRVDAALVESFLAKRIGFKELRIAMQE